MLNTFDYYEKELSYYIKRYNEALSRHDIRTAMSICQYNIDPMLNKYKLALWSRNILDQSFIHYCNNNSQTIIIYISFHRKVLGSPVFYKR